MGMVIVFVNHVVIVNDVRASNARRIVFNTVSIHVKMEELKR